MRSACGILMALGGMISGCSIILDKPFLSLTDTSSTGYVVVEDSDHFNPTTGELTLESFVRIDSVKSVQALFHKWTWGAGAGGYSLELLSSSWFPIMALGNSQLHLTSKVLIKAARWRHLVSTFRNRDAQATIYINGMNTVTATLLGKLVASIVELHIGGRSDGAASGNISGQIARSAVYDRVLTAKEILQNCNTFKARFADLTCGP